MELTGETGTISHSVRLVENTAYIPLRELLDVFGGWTVRWDSGCRTAVAESELLSLTLPADSSRIYVNGTAYDLDSRVFLEDGTTYVPLRSVANLCGGTVTWQGHDLPITLTVHPPTYTEEDLFWLSRIISAESQGESLAGQLAVGSVIMNRAASPDFPDTVYGVVFDQYRDIPQFEPTANGAIYWTPTEQSVLAAKMVLNGTRVADSCLYFYNPSLSSGLWISRNRTYYTTIGCHKFFL